MLDITASVIFKNVFQPIWLEENYEWKQRMKITLLYDKPVITSRFQSFNQTQLLRNFASIFEIIFSNKHKIWANLLTHWTQRILILGYLETAIALINLQGVMNLNF